MQKRSSSVISMRLPADSNKRLQILARRHGWSVSDTSARLVEEGLRRSEFAFIDFRNSPVGRQAYIQGSSLAVWEVLMVARPNLTPAQIAKHLGWPEFKVLAALNYAKAFPDEIERALNDNDTTGFAKLSRMLPHIEEIKIR